MDDERRTPPGSDGPGTPPKSGRPLLHGRLKVSHLRMIVALEDHETVSAAANAMNISQPAASRMIGEMESLLDAQLCERLSRGVRLTPLGQSLARRARSVLLQLLQAEQEITDMRTGRSGAVALGAVTAPAIDLAAPAIGRIRAIHPRIELDLKIDTSNALARDLLASRLDFVIARVPDELDPALFDCLTLGVEEACLIVGVAHPLLGRGPVGLSALEGFDWVTQPRGTPLRRTIEAMFMAQNLPPPGRLATTSSLTLTMILVAQSQAIAPISVEAARYFSARKEARGPIAILSTEFQIVVQPYSLIRVRNRPMSPAAQLVFDFIRAGGGRAPGVTRRSPSGLDERAAALVERPPGVLRADRREHLEAVPLALRFRRRLHRHQIDRMQLAAVDADEPLPNSGSSVGIAFIASTSLTPSSALFICAIAFIRCAVAAYMPACMSLGIILFGMLRLEALGEGARAVVEVPVERRADHRALRRSRARARACW